MAIIRCTAIAVTFKARQLYHGWTSDRVLHTFFNATLETDTMLEFKVVVLLRLAGFLAQ